MKKTPLRHSVLARLRHGREYAARQAFEEARREVETIRARIVRLEKAVAIENDFVRGVLFRKDSARQDMSEGDSRSLAGYRRNIEELRRVILADTLRLAEASEVLERRRRELVEAAEQRKGAFRVQQQAEALATLRAANEEAREADDLFGARHGGKEGLAK